MVIEREKAETEPSRIQYSRVCASGKEACVSYKEGIIILKKLIPIRMKMTSGHIVTIWRKLWLKGQNSTFINPKSNFDTFSTKEKKAPEGWEPKQWGFPTQSLETDGRCHTRYGSYGHFNQLEGPLSHLSDALSACWKADIESPKNRVQEAESHLNKKPTQNQWTQTIPAQSHICQNIPLQCVIHPSMIKTTEQFNSPWVQNACCTKTKMQPDNPIFMQLWPLHPTPPIY